ncbi:MAG: helical backbone metal receptor [Bacteroidota bacterium]
MLLLALGLFALGGCRTDAPAAEGPDTRPLTDDVGRTVTVPTDPQRIVPLAPSITELMVAAGGLDRLAARTLYDDYPDAVQSLNPISTYPLDRERLLGLGTDLVIGTDQVNDVSEGDALAGLGVPAVYLRFEGLDDVPRSLRLLGDLFGTTETAEEAAQRFESRLDQRQQAGPDAPRVLVLIGDDPLYTFGRASYIHDMVEHAGGQSVTTGFAGEGATLSAEWVISESPDVVMMLREPYGPDDLRAAQPAWDTLPVLAEGRVCGVDPDLVSRPGPRLADGIDAMAACLTAVGAVAAAPAGASAGEAE